MATCKLGEKGCWKDGKCHYSHDCENKVLTNADRIRAMNDETLGMFLAEWAEKPWTWKKDGEGQCLAWLQSPAE